jgi:hypothetical protein
MAVTPVCPGGFDLELSIDAGTAWTSHKSTVRHVAPGERAREVLTYNTSDGPVTCSGPPPPTEIELDNLYQEEDTGAYAILRAAHYADSEIWVRWTPADGTKQWTAENARVLSWDEPDLDNDGDSPLFFLATISSSNVTWDDVTA